MAMQRGGMLVGNLGPGGIRRPGTGDPDSGVPNQGLMIIASAPTASIPTSAPTPTTAPKKAPAKPKARKSAKKGSKSVANKSQAASSAAMVMPAGTSPMVGMNPPPASANRNSATNGVERVASPFTMKGGVVSSNSGSSSKASASPALAIKAQQQQQQQQQQQLANAIATSGGGANPMMGMAKPNIATPSPSFANNNLTGRNPAMSVEGGDAGENSFSSILSQRGNQAAQQLPMQVIAGTTGGLTGDMQAVESSELVARQLSEWLTDPVRDNLSDIFNFGTALGDQQTSVPQAMGGFTLGDANFAHLIGNGGISGAMSMPLNMGTTSAPTDGSSVPPAATQNNM
ncbi:hypothetical protein FBU59_001860 [Linderina macrospora]|uniref:Uncharacterized protein n=1 Tax=Linderina macrospora TaxID=4868 RepID=A0ACC1JD55_9FUNG|nr:hypothetical protein FBU59_001860 [Linderina macrospora]